MNKAQVRELSQLQVTVRHLLDVWPAVLQRRDFLRAMSQSEALRGALEKTYAAHVFNSMHTAMSFDLVRAVGALILDRRRGTASVCRAVTWLRNPTVIEELRSHAYDCKTRHRGMFDATFARVPTQLDELQTKIFAAPAAKVIEEIRNKTVAHSAVEHDGSDWKMWAVSSGETLTYGQLDEYIDLCTEAVDTLSHLVLRTACCFGDLPGINQRYVDEYVDALVIGLKQQKQAKQRKREENLRSMEDLMAAPTDLGGAESAS